MTVRDVAPFARCLLVCILSCLWIVSAADDLWADPIALTANWEYQSSSTTADHLDERYAADYSKHVDLTNLMALDLAMRYSRRTDIDSTRQDVIPSMSYLISNDLFLFNLSGTADEEYDDSLGGRSNRSLAGNWSSAWERQAWLPAVTTNYRRNWLEDDYDPQRQDAGARDAGGSLDWDLALARLVYSYNTHDDDDAVSGRQTTIDDHLTRIETEASFWEGRGAMTFSQQFASINTENRARVEGGIALLPVIVTAYAGEAFPHPVTLAGNGALTDGNKDVKAVTVNNPVHPLNLGIRIAFRTVDRVYLYTDTALSMTTSAQFTWDLYTSNNNVDWTLARASLLGSYNPVLQRFEFVLSGYAKEFVKLVAVRDPAITAVNFTEIEAYQAVSATEQAVVQEDVQDNYQTNATLSVQLRRDLQLTSNVYYLHSNSTIGADLTSTDITSGLAWNPNPSWSVRLNGNSNTHDRGANLADATRSYGVSVGFPTVPTVDSIVGVTLLHYYEDTKLVTTGLEYSLQMIADLYTDLNARLNLSVEEDDDQRPGRGGEMSTSQLIFTGRLVPGLVADWSTTYNTAPDQASTVTSEARINWLLSDRLSLRGGISGLWGEEDVADLSCGFDVAMTDTMQVSLTQRLEVSPEANHITAFDWRWTINQYLFMMTSGAFLYGGPRDEWNISSRLNTRLMNL